MNAPRRAPRRRIDGVLLLDKAAGPSSNQALQEVRRLLNAEKGGHTGTLDPFATGLLPLCFGEATKFSSDMLNADKSYRATMCLGMTTDTGDSEGRVVETRPVSVSDSQLQAAVERFRGAIEQIPPMYSALKRDGKPLYAYARAGIDVDRAPRAVTIHKLEIVSWNRHEVVFDVDCSKGTYIRVLAADLGEVLGCGGHLSALRRTKIGTLNLDGALTAEALAMGSAEWQLAQLLPVDFLLSELPRIDVDPERAARFLAGGQIRADVPGLQRVRVSSNGRFLGIGEGRVGGTIQPHRVVAGTAGSA